MRLYINRLSSNSRRAEMTARYLNSPVEFSTVDLVKQEQRQPAFLKLNPLAKVPVLEDDGFVLTESLAIMLYLADKTPGQTLYPTDARARAEVNRWLFWCAHHLSPGIGVLNFENMVKKLVGAGPPNPAEVARGEKLLTDSASFLDTHLAGREWLAGSALTLADFALAAPFMSTVPAKLPVTQFANVQAWYHRVQALAAWKEAS